MLTLAEAKQQQECFLAFLGALQWSKGCFDQASRLRELHACLYRHHLDGKTRLSHSLDVQLKCHLFAVSAWKLIEYRDWLKRFPNFKGLDTKEIDAFSRRDIEDLRDMREHAKEYLEGRGIKRRRWVVSDNIRGSADASSLVGTRIGDRLDFIAFGAVAYKLYVRLDAMPIPYPSMEASRMMAESHIAEATRGG